MVFDCVKRLLRRALPQGPGGSSQWREGRPGYPLCGLR